MASNNPMMSVSIAMCTWNSERFLPELLESLHQQLQKPSEIIACDDGSSDRTLAILHEFGRACNFPVRIIENPTRLGPTKNFEKAISLCNAEFIALCDADDVWYPEKLYTLGEHLESHPGIDAVFCDADLIDSSSARIGGFLWQRARFNCGAAEGGGLLEDRLLRSNVVSGCTMMIRSSARSMITPIPGSWMHDGWIAWMLVLRSRIHACDKRLMAYRIHPSQQVGLPGLSPFARLRHSLQVGYREYTSLADQFRDLLNYVRANRETFGDDICNRIERRYDHSLFRAHLKPIGIGRWREIVRRRFEYVTYSGGWESMVKDALRSTRVSLDEGSHELDVRQIDL